MESASCSSINKQIDNLTMHPLTPDHYDLPLPAIASNKTLLDYLPKTLTIQLAPNPRQ